jgi:hypothetical protein
MTFAVDGWTTLDKKRGWVVNGWLEGRAPPEAARIS